MYTEKKNTGESEKNVQKTEVSGQSAVSFLDHRSKSTAQKAVESYNSTPIQKKTNKTGLPDNLKSGIENLSGMDMSDTKVHYNSSKPAQLNAHAYAQGNQIHLASGQEKHLAHEAWHVVQQKQGRVQPTTEVAGAKVNDSASLEKEADVMGAKSMKGIVQRREMNSYSMHSKGTEVVQRVPIDVAVTGITHLVFLNRQGSLYDKKFKSNELRTVREGDYVEIESSSALRSRRGPNQEVPKNSQDDEHGPQWYVWYLVKRLNGKPIRPHTYIREDTFRKTKARDELRMPIRSTVYGMTGLTAENLKLAYEQGYRDFDAAYMYHKGKTAALFRSFAINQGPVRLIYKFKLKELDAAYEELQALSSIHGVLIHTIMLHDMPAKGPEKEEVFGILKRMAGEFHTRIGLSNVVEEDVVSSDNLTHLLHMARRLGVKISSIQNRMSPSAPDARVREVCAHHGIDYMGFGLKGGGGHGGTCEMGADSAVENYSIETDPLFLQMAHRFGLRPDELRHVMLDWGREHGVHVISQSRSREGMHLMRSAFSPELLNFLRIYAHGNEHFPHHPQHAGLYQPFEVYLRQLGINSSEMNALFRAIPMNLWRLFYKHTLAREKTDSDFVKVMRSMTATRLEELLALNAEKPVKSVTDLGNLFLKFKNDVRAKPVDEVSIEYPESLTDPQLFHLGTSMTTTGKQRLLCDDGYMAIKSGGLEAVKIGDSVLIMIAMDVVATYKKTGASKWQKE